MTSLVLHTGAAFAAVLVALWPAPVRESVGLPRIDARVMDVNLVLLAPPNVEIAAPSVAPAPLPKVAATPIPLPPPSPITDIKPVANSEPVSPPAAVATEPGPRRPTPVSLPPGAVTEFCGVPAIGSSVVFVIDRSGTMGLSGRLERAKRELIASLNLLPPTARFQVIAYHRQAETQIPGSGLMPVSPETVLAATTAMEGLVPEGGTDHAKALRAALALQPDVICFLTDDDDLTAEQVREITRLNRGRASIHALCFVEPYGESAMPALARQNRGVFRIVR
jgi:hypothetical protein